MAGYWPANDFFGGQGWPLISLFRYFCVLSRSADALSRPNGCCTLDLEIWRRGSRTRVFGDVECGTLFNIGMEHGTWNSIPWHPCMELGIGIGRSMFHVIAGIGNWELGTGNCMGIGPWHGHELALAFAFALFALANEW